MNDTHAISLNLLTENRLIHSGDPSQRALEVRLTAPPSASQDKRMALNLFLILDRSGSMQGDKLEYVKQAAAHVLDLLGENDRVSLVVFDDKVSLLAESTQLTPRVKQGLKQRLQGVRTGGSTNLSGGWLAGCQQLAQSITSESEQVFRALLLTDGQANAGITDVEELAVHSRELAARGVSTSTFGVGEGFNEQLLEVMANNGGGNFTYIVSPMDIPDIFAREFSELMAITARDVEVNLEAPKGVEISLLGDWKSEKTGEESLRISLGSLCNLQERNIYFNLQFPPAQEGEEIIIAVKVRGRSESGEILESQGAITFSYTAKEAVESADVDQDLLERYHLAKLSETASQALKHERRGDRAQAATLMQDAIDQSRSNLPPTMINRYEQMAGQMKRGMDEGERKQSHYSSYLDRHGRTDRHFSSRTGSGGEASQALLHQLLDDQMVRVEESPLLRQDPQPLPASLAFDRVEGMLLGLAAGDSLGNTSESRTPAERRAQFGEITDYLPHHYAGNQSVGLPSDDTQMAFWTIEVLLQEDSLNPDVLARRFTREQIFGIGNTVKDFIRAYKDQHHGWARSGQDSAGNGAVMRIAPVLLPYLRRPSAGLWADAILAGMVTHNDYASNAACTAFVGMLWELLAMHSAPAKDWWAETFYRIAAPLEGMTNYSARMSGLNYRGPVARFVREEVGHALQEGWSTLQAAETWGSGAYLLETLPSALHILACYGDDPEQAIIRAVNDTKDNDTVAAIVGAAVGALHGKSALPDRWISGLLGRTNDHNDGHIFRLIEKAKMKYW